MEEIDMMCYASCPDAEHCKRHEKSGAIPTEHQNWFHTKFENPGGMQDCNDFLPTDEFVESLL